LIQPRRHSSDERTEPRETRLCGHLPECDDGWCDANPCHV